jgi:zinc protease
LPGYGDRAWYTADLLASILAGGKSSPLYRDLVYERQLAQDVGVYVQPTELASIFLAVATVRPGVESEVLEAGLSRHLAGAMAAPPAEAELERARNHARVGFREQLESLDQRADMLSQQTTYFDDPERLEGELARYLEIRADEIPEVAAHLLRPERRISLHVVPDDDRR